MVRKEVDSGKDNMIRQMVDVIVREADPKRVILFGSRAREDAGGNSDVDFIIVRDEPPEGGSRRKELGRIWRQLVKFHVPVDLLWYTSAELEKWRSMRNHVVSHALKEGREVYVRS